MDHTNALLTLGGQNNLSFSGEAAAWTGAIALAEPNASSSIAPASRGAVSEEKENTSGLKEHDYIGLTEVSSSVKPLLDVKTEDELNETDLDLGLGLGLGPNPTRKAEDCEKTPAFLLKQKDGLLKAQQESYSKPVVESARYSFPEGAAALQKPWPNAGPMRPMTAEALNSASLTAAREYENPGKAAMYVQDFGEGPSRTSGSTFYGGNLKNGTKRGYTEAMIEASRFSAMGGTRIGTAVVGKNGEGEVKALPKHQQGAYMSNWVPLKPSVPAHWPAGLEQSAAHPFASNKPGIDRPVADRAPSAYNAPESRKEPSSTEPPPPKGQVVGWPPIRSYRKQNLAKPTEMYVKVNMDGMTVGRKVDLNAHTSYEGLLLALEEMFQPSSNGGQGTSQSVSARDGHTHDVKQFRLLNGSDFVLTYEDQDGDWMLVGDVPWSMFVTTVRRLRITRGAEATGLAPRRPDKIK